MRTPYVRVLGIQLDSAGRSRRYAANAVGVFLVLFVLDSHPPSLFTEAEEQEFLAIARSPDVYERIVNSIAPAIYGSDGVCMCACTLYFRLRSHCIVSADIKRAVAVLLFGGSAKQCVMNQMLMQQ